jgi:hypothetical protein
MYIFLLAFRSNTSLEEARAGIKVCNRSTRMMSGLPKNVRLLGFQNRQIAFCSN